MRYVIRSCYALAILMAFIFATPGVGQAAVVLLAGADDPTFKFTCCDKAPVAIDDLEVTYSGNLNSVKSAFPAADACTGTFAGKSSTLDCKMIAVGDIIFQQVTPDVKVVSACWTGDSCVAEAIPTQVPEPSTWALMALSFLSVGVIAYRRRPKVETLGRMTKSLDIKDLSAVHAAR
jgi:PEP-CTERM motif